MYCKKEEKGGGKKVEWKEKENVWDSTQRIPQKRKYLSSYHRISINDRYISETSNLIFHKKKSYVNNRNRIHKIRNGWKWVNLEPFIIKIIIRIGHVYDYLKHYDLC